MSMNTCSLLLKKNKATLLMATRAWQEIAKRGTEKDIADALGQALYLGYVLGKQGEKRFREVVKDEFSSRSLK